MKIESINPTTGETLQRYSEMPAAELESLLSRADTAQRNWRRVAFPDRAERITAAAERLRQNRDDTVRLMALEMGKPIRQGQAEIEKCAWGCEYFAREAERMLGEQVVPVEAGLPEDLFRSVLIRSDSVKRLIENPIVRGVSLTGSVAAGKAVAAVAGANLKETVLELGGSDPYVVGKTNPPSFCSGR